MQNGKNSKRDEGWPDHYLQIPVGTIDAPRLPQFLRFRDRIDISETMP
jgi:hypothetical protein